jgi:hypothetical protein
MQEGEMTYKDIMVSLISRPLYPSNTYFPFYVLCIYGQEKTES